ncbi:hypothetical protein BDP55DRAFT_634371 [Colletotrichum godetiae]|uniref:ubiquitinyl hydrolase 1 n=1 Tax=Colletotrichum godetiae TaxID=1209918 RepID=A0AAJ0AFV3_9PEZI|nr:uncharacterized protein BDP55DRAFT_634371 [Colletotrichum godetiae]KAK1673137.1 hypothetical protein BDP55DRAFT_634371 [Colletotrichum godetiae]
MTNHTDLYIIQHVFLPPQLPQADDFSPENESALVQFVKDSVADFYEHVPSSQKASVRIAIGLMEAMMCVHRPLGDTVAIDQHSLLERLMSMAVNDIIPLNVRAQNAGVLITKTHDALHMEAFELSPTNEAVMSTLGRLRRTFPGTGISIDLEKVSQQGCQEALTAALSTMSSQPAPGTQPLAKKAGHLHQEKRDTTSPKIVTELLFSSFQAIGKPLDGTRIWKNTREEVNWSHALLPWRRSPTWLLVRVSLQLAFGRSLNGTNLYKMFMIFFMARVLRHSIDSNIETPSDLILVMVSKLSRRMRKISSGRIPAIVDRVHQAMLRSNQLLAKRWDRIQQRDSLSLATELADLKTLDFDEDSHMHLPVLDSFLASIDSRRCHSEGLDFIPSWTLVKYNSETFPSTVQIPDKEHLHLHLSVFEIWVERHLQAWLQREANKGYDGSCAKIRSIIEEYHTTASKAYAGNPESVSVMLLTILELWIACDKAAIYLFPMLRDYNPEVPTGVLQNLLLPLKGQMKRLHDAEKYLLDRNQNCKTVASAPSIYYTYGSRHCFPVRHFEMSSEHQRLKEKIESKARQDREKKMKEFNEKKEKYNNLMRKYHASICDYDNVFDRWTGRLDKRHSNGCSRHSYLSQANSLRIDIHEWPLPRRDLEAKSVVFELLVPVSFGQWREATVFFLFGVLKVTPQMGEKVQGYSCSLERYPGLFGFFQERLTPHFISLLSEAKPHTVTHRKGMDIATATEKQVCLSNGLHYAYYDHRRHCFMRSFGPSEIIPQLCTYELPAASMALQKFLFRPSMCPNGPTPNTVIATLHECPHDMSLEEYRALASIPLGYNLQWINILLQLFAPSVDFKKRETAMVILQCIHQAGPGDNSEYRRAHTICQDERFGNKLLGGLAEAIARYEENWQSSSALAAFTAVTRRLLSLTPFDGIQKQCFGILSQVRGITFRWAQKLREKAQDAHDKEKLDFQRRAFEVLLICADTFNMDEHFQHDLFYENSAVSTFLQCCIAIQEGQILLGSLGAFVHHLYSRWQRTSYLHHSYLGKKILSGSSAGIDHAISANWSSYEPSHEWKIVSATHSSWLTSLTAATTSHLFVQLNLITGELLVNGLPLDHLPPEYLTHVTYQSLFGRFSLEILPTAKPGMTFSSKRHYAGHAVNLGLGSEGNLLVNAMKGQKEFELVPKSCFEGLFPTKFVNDFVQWYDYENGCVEFCDVEKPWKHTISNWKLLRDEYKGTWKLQRTGSCLVNINSRSAKLISKILKPLEDPFSIHVIHLVDTAMVSIELPRAMLEFGLKRGEVSIMSRQYRGMSVDPNQAVGTLVGLKDKLVLRVNKPPHPALPVERKILVLEGNLSFLKEDGHIEVTVSKGFASRVHAYEVDIVLNRLVSNGSRQSKLFLCYLHALTSFAIPDPLTHRTGTEEALSILSSASIRSFDVLTTENAKLLTEICHLAPGRGYYPSHERVMQQVDWNPQLGFLSQHGLYREYVEAIFEQNTRSKFFSPLQYVGSPELEPMDSRLLARDNIRTAMFRVSGFGAECYTVDHDTFYEPRDRLGSSQGFWAYSASKLVLCDQPILSMPLPDSMETYLWKFLSDTFVVLGPHSPCPITDITYNAEFLLDPSRFITEHWTTLQSTLKTCNKYKLITWLATIAFAECVDFAVIQTLASFRTSTTIHKLSAPGADDFHLSNGTSFVGSTVSNEAKAEFQPFDCCPEMHMQQLANEEENSFLRRREIEFLRNREGALRGFLDTITAQWPCRVPTLSSGYEKKTNWRTYIRVDSAMVRIRAHFKIWYDNLQFRKYLREIACSLPTAVKPLELAKPLLATPDWPLTIQPRFLTEASILRNSSPPPQSEELPILDQKAVCKRSKRVYRLPALLSRLGQPETGQYERGYVKALISSMKALERHQLSEDHDRQSPEETAELLVSYLHGWQATIQETYDLVVGCLLGAEGSDPSRFPSILPDFYAYPRISTSALLQRLNHSNLVFTPAAWKMALTHFGIALSQFQRAKRMLGCFKDPAALANELRNPGHTNWSPFKYPDTLLLEVESGLIVREVQEEIAASMRSPPDDENAVMQLNMGEGKSSVIVPIVAAALADGTRLVRVIVARPQSKQMLEMLDSKLGGLLQRRIFHMPFSRAVKVGPAEASAIRHIFEECMDVGGVLLVQPEHILSFKLMAIETAIAGNVSVSRMLASSKDFLDRFTRDIVDESDENFNVKFELVYTMGTQRPVEHSPERWMCIHQVLEVMRKLLPGVQEEFPSSFEIGRERAGCFPPTRILDDGAKATLLDPLARHLSEAGLSGLPMGTQPASIQQAVYTYISKTTLTQVEVDAVEKSDIWSPTTQNSLLLLRGLIAGQILSFVFCQKRWRVHFGLDHNRRPSTQLSVPYRAKDNPSARSEFSHPDVVITLTSLSYYYGGMTDSDLFLSFEHLFLSDQADMEYRVWVQDSYRLPHSFHQLPGVNLEDRPQCVKHVFPCLRHAKAVIDYFLQHLVFPKEMKEFPHRLSASGWDIGERTANATTGFSGTNDSRAFLPLSVKQVDLPDQKHTNALVLEYLLQDENSVAMIPAADKKNTSKSDAETLLEIVVGLEPPARVILDVGAQILELENFEVAQRWLEMTEDNETTQAVIFCDEHDNICAVDRKGRVESFQTSPFATQTDVCLVFLDEAHTRGTDLKLPAGYRAAVTLGANLTKDRLVQACMRMRKLGKGQSVVFCVSDEIKHKIATQSKVDESSIEVAHILEWSISETLVDMERGIWLWANQGRRYQQHRVLWDECVVDGSTNLTDDHAERFLEDEAQNLETRYRPGHQSSADSMDDDGAGDAITERLLQFDRRSAEAATFREEQERELSPEVEQEREVQKALPASPAEHYIHPDLRAFVTSGVLNQHSAAFMFAFQSLSETSAAQHYDVNRLSQQHGFLVTADFARTIIPLGKGYMYGSDLFQRSVQWILTRASAIDTAIIISPHEAQELMSHIQLSRFVSLRVYAPRPNLGFRPLDDLNLFTIPHRRLPQKPPLRLVTEINLFSGQLYVKSMDEYRDLRRFLALESEGSNAEGKSQPSQIIDRESLMQFMKVLLMKIRRNCESIDKTHVGRILEQRTLDASDFEGEN